MVDSEVKRKLQTPSLLIFASIRSCSLLSLHFEVFDSQRLAEDKLFYSELRHRELQMKIHVPLPKTLCNIERSWRSSINYLFLEKGGLWSARLVRFRGLQLPISPHLNHFGTDQPNSTSNIEKHAELTFSVY
jgi:hypothetical protein